MKKCVTTAVWVALFCMIVGWFAGVSAQTQEDINAAVKAQVLKRKVAFEITNSSAPKKAVPYVSGKGVFPVRLDVHDNGRSPIPRRLQVVVTIFTNNDPKKQRPKAGERFFIRTDPRILTTAPDKDGTSSFELDIPMLPGDYVAHIFLCDPDRPSTVSLLDHPTLPTFDELPGAIMSGSSLLVHVDRPDNTAGKASKK